tara:strand:- start:1271 stop:2659 length:1389 start_codon:yes stop_codon:yes gene_type:complete
MAKFPLQLTTKFKKILKLANEPSKTITKWLFEKKKITTPDPLKPSKKKEMKEKTIDVKNLQKLLIQITTKINELIDNLNGIPELEKMIITEIKERLKYQDKFELELKKIEAKSLSGDRNLRREINTQMQEFMASVNNRLYELESRVVQTEQIVQDELDDITTDLDEHLESKWNKNPGMLGDGPHGHKIERKGGKFKEGGRALPVSKAINEGPTTEINPDIMLPNRTSDNLPITKRTPKPSNTTRGDCYTVDGWSLYCPGDLINPNEEAAQTSYPYCGGGDNPNNFSPSDNQLDFHLASQLGKKAIVIYNFFPSCSPCNSEASRRAYQEIYNRYRGRDDFIWIHAISNSGQPYTCEQWSQIDVDYGLDGTIPIIDVGSYPSIWQTTYQKSAGAPSLIIIGKDGRLVNNHEKVKVNYTGGVGYVATEESIQLVISRIDEALQIVPGPTPGPIKHKKIKQQSSNR